jgi:hypothetical protein
LLYQACIYGYLDLIQWILQNKPVDLDLNKKIHLTLGQTFAEKAYSKRHMDIVKELVKHGAIFTPPLEIIYKSIDHSKIEKFIQDIAISSDKVDDALNIICNAMNDEDKAQILKSSYFVQYIVCSYLAEHQEINNQNAQDILKEYGFLEQFFGYMAYFYYYLKHEVLGLEYTPEYIVPLIATLDSNDSNIDL